MNPKEYLKIASVKDACSAEAQRRTKLSGIDAQLAEARKELARNESALAAVGLDEDAEAMDRKIDAVSRERIRIEQIERLRGALIGQEKSTLAAIGVAAVGIREKQRAALEAELEKLKKATAPHLLQLEKLEGVAFAPAFEAWAAGRISLQEGAPEWLKCSKSFQLGRQIEDLRGSIERLTSQPEELGRQVWSEYEAGHAPSLGIVGKVAAAAVAVAGVLR